MEIKDLIKPEFNVAIHQALVIAKQDIAIGNGVKALNEIIHTNKIEFTYYNEKFGINEELLSEVRNLISKLEKAKFGRF